MTKKIFINIAAFSVIAMCALGCDTTTNDSNGKTDSSITTPVVELPPSVGENPFVGKTFETDESFKNVYIFSSDGKTITYYILDTFHGGKKVIQTQYKCSVNANKKEVAWHVEKTTYGSGQLYSFEELKSGKSLEDYEATLKEELDKGNITTDKFNEYLKDYKERIDGDIACGSIEDMFTRINRYKYVYNENKGTLDLVEQFEKSSAHFYNEVDFSPNNELSHACVSIYLSSSGYSNGYIDFFERDSMNEYISFYPQSMSDDEIVFNREDDKNDTFTASYTLTGSGNDTKIELSFTYNEQLFNPTLYFTPYEIHLTEEE